MGNVCRAASSGKVAVDRARSLHPAAPEKEVLCEQVRVLYQTPAILAINVANALVVAFVLRTIYPFWIVAAWFGLFCIIVPARVFIWLRYLRERRPIETATAWGRRFALGAFATGCLWGLAGSVILLTPNPAYHVFIAFVLGGMVAGAVLSDAAHLPALIGFAAPAILPALLAFLFRADEISIAMVLLLAAFAGVLGMVGLRANQWIVSSVRRGIMQASLTADLEKEIAERTWVESELRRSNESLKVVASSVTEILHSQDFDRSVPKVLELVGRTMGVSRIELCETDGAFLKPGRYGWSAPGVPPMSEAQLLSHPAAIGSLSASLLLLARGDAQAIITREADEPVRSFLNLRGALSFLMAPVFVEEKWWGVVAVDNCAAERAWSAVEIDTFRTLTELIGGAIADARTHQEMADAGQIIRNSSTILYRLSPRFPYPIVYVSSNIERFGYSESQLLSARDGRHGYAELFQAGDRQQILAAIAEITDGDASEIRGEYRMHKAVGCDGWAESRMRPVRDGDRRLTALEGVLIDITDRKIAEAEVARLTYTDLLTGLPNRVYFMERLFKAFAAAKRAAGPFAILYLDLDRFKDINETLGHSKGDALLKAVAERLWGFLRDTDLIARIGGDEFAVFLGDVPNPADAAIVATRIMDLMTAPYEIGGADIHVTASIGIAIYRAAMAMPEDMLREADLALYQVKDSGRNQYGFYSEELGVAVRERVAVVEGLRGALDRNEFQVYYQPQVELPSGSIIGVEALLRWNHPELGLVSPGNFIPIAEKTGMIEPLGRWVLTEVCRQLRIWRKEGINPPIMGVNLSAAQLTVQSEFERDLAQALEANGIDPATIELELTETVLMQTIGAQVGAINRLRALGVRIAIDDFGTGYSSLEYLRDYRVDRIKIAQQFVSRLPDNAGSRAIVRATIGLAREFEIEVIAEGCETAAQLEFLVAAGCRRIQGYYFSRPAPAEEAAKMLRRGVLTPPT